MERVLALAAVLMLLAGCIGPETPAGNNTQPLPKPNQSVPPAPPPPVPPPQPVNLTEGFTFTQEDAECGSASPLRKTNTATGFFVNGSVALPHPCYTLEYKFQKGMDVDILWLEKKELQTFAPCVQCVAEIPVFINVTARYNRFEVYMDGVKLFPDLEAFCGWETNSSCTLNTDCMVGGCSSQVCHSSSEKGLVTTCEWADCYDDKPYGVRCGCVNGKCQWN